MEKRSVVFLILLALVFAAVLLYFVPCSTPIDLQMEAVKIDSEGNELGTYVLSIKGSKKDYLFQPSRLDVSIDPIDHINVITPADSITKFGSIPGMIETFLLGDYLHVSYGGWVEITKEGIFCTLAFSPDMQRWIFCDDSNRICYVASVDGAYTTAELMDYFQSMIP